MLKLKLNNPIQYILTPQQGSSKPNQMVFKGQLPKQTVIKKLKKASSLNKIADQTARSTSYIKKRVS